VLWGFIGFLVCTALSYVLVLQFSPNPRDRELEAAMTSVFFFGPFGGFAAAVIGFLRGNRPSRTRRPDGGSIPPESNR
jgi:hypothetical protein